MEQLQKTLVYIVNHRLFASSPTAFGKLFSEKDRNRGIRIVNGTTKNFDSTLQRFKEKFDLSLVELQQLVEADRLANALYRSFPKDACENGQKEYGNKLLLAIMRENYKELPDDFANHVDDIKVMRFSERKQYLWFLALFFIKYGMYRVYHSNFEQDYLELWKDLGRCFKEGLPNRIDLPTIVDVYVTASLYREICHHSVWGLVDLMTMIMDIAEKPENREEWLRNFQLFDWDDDSYWHTPNEPFTFGESDFWWFSTIDTKLPNCGYYTALHIKSGKNKENFKLLDVYNIMFIDGNEEDYTMIQLSQAGKPENATIGGVRYDRATRTLYVDFDEDVEFPNELQMIDVDNPNGRDNKVWKGIIEQFDEKCGDNIIKQATRWMTNVNFLDDEYEVDDVIIGRKGMFIAIKELLLPNQPIREYSIELDKHEALKCIHPSDEACVIRKDEDGELYIVWFEKDLQIKLKEFKEEEL